ncbi:thiamine phosphate synthase [Roseburia hominis]
MIMCTYKNRIEGSAPATGSTGKFPHITISEYPDDIFQNIIAVTNRRLAARPLPEQVERVCRYHPKAVILREKDLSETEYTALAQEIMEICKKYDVPCILHTYLNTAKELGCPAIHLPLPLLRKYADRSGPAISTLTTIGVSVHSAREALEAELLGAAYLTAGHIYATDCKKGIPPSGTGFLRKVCQSVSIPVYAIGGIKPDPRQISEIISCGASGGCIMSGMMTL